MGSLRGGAIGTPFVFTVGTVLTWIGWVWAFRTIALAISFGLKPKLDGGVSWAGIGRSVLIAGVSLMVGRFFLSGPETRPATGMSLPLVWWIMPFPAWLALGSTVLAGVFLLQGQGEISREMRVAKFRSAVICLVGLFAGVALYGVDPENKISVLKGSIPISPAVLLTLVILAAVAVGAMGFIARAPRFRLVGKAAATHAALIAGSVIFGIPLLYLLITSFKEDRDMSSAKGIVWVPRVQRTLPYLDPKNPLYETTYEGQTVAAAVTHEQGGKLYLDIERPLGMRGLEIITTRDKLRVIPRDAPLVRGRMQGLPITGMVVENMEDGSQRVKVLEPASLKGREAIYSPNDLEPIRDVGLRWQNYTEALSYLPPETSYGLVFLRNTLMIAVLSVLGTVLSSALAAYAFARMRFPGRDAIFAVFLSTMMLPGAVTMLPQFLIFRQLGWIDTLLPLWAPAFFGSAFNIFMLRQFFRTVPMELEDAAKIDGCSYARTFWSVMLPQIKPALAVIGIWTFMGAWNNFMGPLIYINSPTKMPISYALQLFMSDRGSEPGLLMAFVTLTVIPVLLLFFFAQRYFIEGVTLSGLGGK